MSTDIWSQKRSHIKDKRQPNSKTTTAVNNGEQQHASVDHSDRKDSHFFTLLLCWSSSLLEEHWERHSAHSSFSSGVWPMSRSKVSK